MAALKCSLASLERRIPGSECWMMRQEPVAGANLQQGYSLEEVVVVQSPSISKSSENANNI